MAHIIWNALLVMMITCWCSFATVTDHDPTSSCRSSCYKSIISFGESYADTAQALGLSLLAPNLANLSTSVYREGINFAVGGASAANASFYRQQNVSVITNDSLLVQLDWFLAFLPKMCSTCNFLVHKVQRFLKSTLVMVGEFGGNDYFNAMRQGKTREEALSYVPVVVGAIEKTIKVLLENGAVDVVVQALPPAGCLPRVLTVFASNETSDYNEYGCLKSFDEFCSYHNSHLKLSIQSLIKLYPHSRIVYADYYNVAMLFYKYPYIFGFNNTSSACCGKGGRYNFDPAASAFCGNPGISACADPNSHVQWDGVHLTERAYQWVATSILTGLYTKPPIDIPPKCFHPIPTDD